MASINPRGLSDSSTKCRILSIGIDVFSTSGKAMFSKTDIESINA